MPLVKKFRGNINYLLFVQILLHFTYPLSELSTNASLIYVTIYTLMVGFGAYITAVSRQRLIISIIFNGMTIGTGIMWISNSTDLISLFAFYIVFIINMALTGWTILEYIFTANEVTGSVLSAGITFYLLLGNIFTPIYFLLNALVRLMTGVDAFVVNTQTVELTWQRMYYFSFSTLTTLGYGDITPVSPFVEPFVTAEAVIGVLYIAVLMARLVSMYERHNQDV
jgi:hypothetical protein